MDLSGYLGENNVQFKFRLVSDLGVTEDGYYFDDFAIYTDANDNAGVDELSQNDVLVYPNPANNELSISLNDLVQMDKITITNELGQLVMTIYPKNPLISINIAHLSEGLYFINAQSADKGRITKRFVILR